MHPEVNEFIGKNHRIAKQELGLRNEEFLEELNIFQLCICLSCEKIVPILDLTRSGVCLQCESDLYNG